MDKIDQSRSNHDQKSGPQVSIAIPVFNGAKKIVDCIQSASSQSLKDIEILVSDNASTDGTVQIVKELAEKDSRIKILTNEKNRGSISNINRLRGAATGKYFTYLADDVRYEESFIESCVSVLETRPDVIGCYSAVRIATCDGSKILSEHREDIDLDIPDPFTRCSLLSKLKLGNMFYGVFRTDSIRNTYNHYRIRKPQYLFDRYMLCPMAVMGRIVQLEESLMTRLMDEWQENRGKSKRKAVYTETIRRLEQNLAIPKGRSNLPTIDSIHDVCEELVFCDLGVEEREKLAAALFESLSFKYRRYFEEDLKRARVLISDSSTSLRMLGELSESLGRAFFSNVKADHAVGVQLQCAELNSQVIQLIVERLNNEGAKRGPGFLERVRNFGRRVKRKLFSKRR